MLGLWLQGKAVTNEMGDLLAQSSVIVAPHDAVLSDAEILYQAQAVTVKVLSGQTWGTGILIEQQNNRYTVITNAHVLVFGQTDQSYRIETPDGLIYPAKVSKNINLQQNDLALVQFQAQNPYSTASLSSNVRPIVGEPVFAVGFPSEGNTHLNRGLLMTQGIIALIAEQAFGGGYQIGYTNQIHKGMSGGALFNQKGEIIAINGMHQYPLWGNPYVFEDGSVASKSMKEQMSQYSWAIPIQRLLRLLP